MTVEKARERMTFMQEEEMDRSATHVPTDVGGSYWLVTDLHTFKKVGEDTGEAFALRGRAEVTP
jgi:hypothetical protein